MVGRILGCKIRRMTMKSASIICGVLAGLAAVCLLNPGCSTVADGGINYRAITALASGDQAALEAALTAFEAGGLDADRP